MVYAADSTVFTFLRDVSVQKAALAKAKAIYLDRLAPDFSPFEFIPWNELMLSRLIGWLLDPRGNHGQGGRFLKLFAARCELHWTDAECATAQLCLEYSTEAGRLDILVQSGQSFLAIENKPWAEDQHNQLERYISYLQESKKEWRLAYITLSGTDPSEYSLDRDPLEMERSKRRLHTLSYERDIVEWLGQCRTKCKADKVNMFIEHMISAIQSEIGGAVSATDLDHITEEITKSKEYVAAAVTVVAVIESVKSNLIEMLTNQVSQQLSHRGWKVSSDLSPSKYAWLSIDFSRECDCIFCLEFQQSRFRQIVYGICQREEVEADISSEQKILRSQFGSGKTSQWWPWYQYPSTNDLVFPVDMNWDNNPEIWSSIPDGTLAGHIVRCAEKIIQPLMDGKSV